MPPSRLSQLEKLLAADPSDPDVLYMLAQEHAKAGDTSQAVTYFDRCLALSPTYHYAYFHKARALQSSGDDPAASATLRAGLKSARAHRDDKAAHEISGFLLELGEDP